MFLLRLLAAKLPGLLALSLALAALSATPPALSNSVDFLPPEIERLIKKHGINKDRIGLIVQRTNGTILAAHQSQREFNPASVAKIITALAAMDLLGAEFHWETTVAKRGAIKDGVLNGDLYLIGGGDPYLTLDNFLYILNALRNSGIREINGDLIIDNSIFALPPHNPGAFDGVATSPYNVGGGGLIVNFKAQRVVFEANGKKINVYTDPPNQHFKIDNRVTSGKTRCRNWRGKIKERLIGDTQQMTLRVSGNYSPRCGKQGFYISVLEHPSYVAGVFGALWQRLGGSWRGSWKVAKAPQALEKADTLLVHTSPSLPIVLNAMNKFSNNVIARNVFLSLAAADNPPPYTPAAAAQTMQNWLTSAGAPGVFLENGSGLSRKTRITPAEMAHLLSTIWQHPYRAEIISSLPILGKDGTLKKRMKKSDVAGSGHLKTGSLSGITTLSGFFRDQNGDTIMLTLFSEKQSSSRIRRLQEDIIRWAWAVNS